MPVEDEWYVLHANNRRSAGAMPRMQRLQRQASGEEREVERDNRRAGLGCYVALFNVGCIPSYG